MMDGARLSLFLVPGGRVFGRSSPRCGARRMLPHTCMKTAHGAKQGACFAAVHLRRGS